MVEENSQGTYIEHYKLIRLLGDGTFGTGYLAQDINANNKRVCIKVFKGMDAETEKTFTAEIDAGQAGLVHDNVLLITGAGRSQIKKNGNVGKDCFYIVSELAENGEAFDYVDIEKALPEPLARQMFSQLVAGMEFIHSKGIAHRDLKLENCFLDKNVTLKVADFGMAKLFEGEKGQALTTTCGTANYMAPELTKNKNGEYDGTKVDIFAMGVILYIMVQGGFPFARAEDDYYKKLQKHPNQYIESRKHAIRTTDIEFFELAIGMTKRDPAKRFTMEKIKNHKWMQRETATPEQLCEHFYSLQDKLREMEASNQEANKELQKNFIAAEVCRGEEDEVKPSKDLMNTWKSNLEYETMAKEDAKKARGFFFKVEGVYILSSLYEFLRKNGIESEVIEKNISDLSFQAKFSWSEKLEKLPQIENCPELEGLKGDSDYEDENIEEVEDQKINIEINLRQIEDDDDLYFCQIHRKKGSAEVFGNFYRSLMKNQPDKSGEICGGLSIFVDN